MLEYSAIGDPGAAEMPGKVGAHAGGVERHLLAGCAVNDQWLAVAVTQKQTEFIGFRVFVQQNRGVV